MNFRKPAVQIWTFVIFTAIGLFFAAHRHLDDLLYNPAMPFSHVLVQELAGSYSAMLLIPFLNWISLRFPITRATLLRVLGANAAGFALYTIAHTTINSLFRFAALPLVGVAGVTPWNMLNESGSEAANDFVYYGMLMGTLYLINHFIESQELETKLAEAKLENLRLQLHPHFLFNTLNAISSVMYEDVARADAMLSKLSEFLRRVLDAGSVHNVPLDEELEVERMYVDIMTTRLERSLQLRIDVADDARDATIPFMLLQPLLENSIRHGMGSSRTALVLRIAVSRNGETIVIHVDDDGLGMNGSTKRGIGLTNVASRLEHMYGSRASFSIASRAEGGTRATLSFPFNGGI